MQAWKCAFVALGLLGAPLAAQPAPSTAADPEMLCMVASMSTSAMARSRGDIPPQFAQTARAIEGAANYFAGVITQRYDDEQLAAPLAAAMRTFAASTDRGTVLNDCIARYQAGVARIEAPARAAR